MKILYVTNGCGVDYQSDALFHGLVSRGHDVTDSRLIWHQSGPIPFERKVRLYGKGISIAGNLPDRSMISRDRDEIRGKIEGRYYDVVVYGSIHRSSEFLDLVGKVYPRRKVAIVDGEDPQTVDERYLPYGIYFKRELTSDNAGKAEPISFAVPAVKYDYPDKPKEYELAQCIPGVLGTYVTFREETYYHEYAISRFALTFKKTGWDCLRHYEIVAAGAIPLFTDIAHLPSHTMTTWPRELQLRANEMAYRWLNGSWRNETDYCDLLEEFREHGRAKMTTEALADYVVGKLG